MSHHNHSTSQQRIGWVFGLNVSFTLIEFFGGWLTNSTRLPMPRSSLNLWASTAAMIFLLFDQIVNRPF